MSLSVITAYLLYSTIEFKTYFKPLACTLQASFMNGLVEEVRSSPR